MCNASNHPPDCRCGWGGDGHLGLSAIGSFATESRADGYAVVPWGTTSGLCRPTTCPECGEAVYFVRHNGGSVWFDELGHPWPVHGCFAKGLPTPMATEFGVHEAGGVDPAVTEALLVLLDETSQARLGQVTRVTALGARVRIVTVVQPDGAIRQAVIELPVAASKLVGAMVVWQDRISQISVVVDRFAIQGWWQDTPPGRWRYFNLATSVRLGDVVSVKDIGIAAVLQATPYAGGIMVKLMLVTGVAKTYMAASDQLLWLTRSETCVAQRRLLPPAPETLPMSCPYCAWQGSKFKKHMALHHAGMVA